MRYYRSAALVAFPVLLCSIMLGQDPAHASRAIREAQYNEGKPGIVAGSVTVGQNLEETATVNLMGPTPDADLRVTLTSSDPAKLLLAAKGDGPGAATIELTISAGFRHSPAFFVRGLADTGAVTFSATAPGYGSATFTATLGRSGFVIGGPGKLGAARFRTTTGVAVPVTVSSVLLDPTGNVAAIQAIGSESPVKVDVTSSNPEVGAVETLPAVIAKGSSSAELRFKPAGPGNSTLAVNTPAGFAAPSRLTSITAMVIAPGLAISDHVAIGYNLQVNGILNLGQPAPPEGLAVTLTSSDPSKLVLSTAEADPGSKSITVKIPAGGVIGGYYLQALSDSGDITYTASAPGFLTRTATIPLRPSGLALAPPGGLDGPRGFLASLSSSEPVHLSMWLAQLDPVYHSSTDQTTQSLRAGVTLTVELTDSNSEIGKTTSPIVLKSGQENGAVVFTPLTPGAEVISVVTPKGYTQSKNHSSLKVIVTK